LEQALGKTGQKTGFSIKSKEAVPETEVLEQPLYINLARPHGFEEKIVNFANCHELSFEIYVFLRVDGVVRG
jgi:hypothetical protein